ncbi:MAG: hypothetical protein PSU94_10390 [Lacunisphaera sp.]|nr:hypothetical protein [Lacunisphaera sp.]
MYHVILVNLSADARCVAAQAYVEKRALPPDALADLLRDFCEIDPIENAVADTEIRVKVGGNSYLLRTEQKKLILYDAHRRDLPGQIFTVAQAMEELDGSAAKARAQTILLARGETEPAPTGPVAVAPPPVLSSKSRVIALAVMAGLMAAGLWLVAPEKAAGPPAGFVPLAPEEWAERQAGLAGVYLTGSEPGQHGIVVTDPEQLKLFELGTVAAPRVIYAECRLGRLGGQLGFATDQPGGFIEITADGNLAYSGEIFQRVP